MKITIDTAELSELDVAVMKFLADGVPASAPAPAEPDAPKPPAKKAAPAKATAPKAEPQDDGETVTQAQVMERATNLVSSGGTQRVKAALEQVGVKRVSDLPEEKFGEFLAALGDD